MASFKETTHLSEILEDSEINSVVIFKYSNNCGSSDRLKKELEEKDLESRAYLITVQNQPVLSQKISEWFQIKHETPQIIVVDKGKVTYSESHEDIQLEKFT